jgi:hypothetical protein
MKKITALLLLFIAVKASAQKSVLFRMKYLPQHTYNILMTAKVNIKADLSGNQEILDKISEQGITMPAIIILNINSTGVTKTGVLAADNSFPMTTTYQVDKPNITVNGKNTPIPVEQKPAVTIYAHVLPDGKVKGDSVTGKKKDTSGKTASQMFNSLQKHIKFPNRRMHVGESFTQDLPFTMPMNMGGDSVTSKTVYTLVSIADGKAYFDMTQTIDMKIDTKQTELTIKGNGAGKMVYSIKDNFLLTYSTTMNMKVNGSVISTLTVNGDVVLDLNLKNDIN